MSYENAIPASDELPLNITIGEKYSPAMKVQTQEEADAYFERLVKHSMRHGRLRPEAEQLERSNLGYFAGYYGDETRERIERLFNCSHPIFGRIANGKPTQEEALERGIKAGVEGRL